MAKATNEQLKAVLSTTHRLVVQAYAGAGKTFTLIEFALANSAVRILYLAYSKAIQEEKKQAFTLGLVGDSYPIVSGVYDCFSFRRVSNA